MQESMRDVIVTNGNYRGQKLINEPAQLVGNIRFGKRGWFAHVIIHGHGSCLIRIPNKDSIVDKQGISVSTPTKSNQNTDSETLTDEEIKKVLESRFNVFDRMAYRAAQGTIKSLIVSSAPGTGKTHTILKYIPMAEQNGRLVRVLRGGNATAAGMFEAMWDTREGGMLVVDDCDSVFDNLSTLNLMKAALDTTESRLISWTTQGHWLQAKGIENSFEFHGSMVFLTNKNFDQEIAKENSLKVHLEALMDRSFYLDLKLHKPREIYARILMVVETSDILMEHQLSKNQGQEILNFIGDNLERFRFLSLRTLMKCIELYNAVGSNWREDACDFLIK